ncbi:MAG TPA: hypothetical protein VGP20_04420 [Steroidobacteraceae bacterium]|jgi:hypothetical protein|nr:hypothetical protein [Steroidobacteraceae bacterium]
MRVVARKSSNSQTHPRDRMLSERTRAAALRELFPQVGTLRIELVFNDLSPHVPSPQLHTLYPAASAFFRFACPCADCDGDFDLTAKVKSLLGDSSERRQLRGSSSGQLSCQGIRLRDRAGSKACSMQVNFRLLCSALHAK